MAVLKNIIFDLGGVLLNIDYNKTKEAFVRLGFDDFDAMYSQFTADDLFAQLETGQISTDAFYENMLQRANDSIAQLHLQTAWNAMLLDFRVESLALLEKLKENYNLYLLSNTNAIHLAAFAEAFTAQTGNTGLNDYFIKAYYSHEVGLRKPNDDIFKFVLEDAALEAHETLFIDDSYNNIATAARLGFQTHLLLPGEKIEDIKGYW